MACCMLNPGCHPGCPKDYHLGTGHFQLQVFHQGRQYRGSHSMVYLSVASIFHFGLSTVLEPDRLSGLKPRNMSVLSAEALILKGFM